MNQTILRAEDLKAFYVLDALGTRKVVKAVNGVNLEIRQDEVYGIAGESGCGKTTLLRALIAAIEPPLRLLGGKTYYRVNGEEINIYELSAEEKRKLRWEYVSYVPQGSMSVLNPVVKLKESFRDFIESHVRGKTQEQAFAMAKSHIAELGLPPKILDAYPHQLSGGMRQRVLIAMAFACKPALMVADEPTTSLDVTIQAQILDLLDALTEEHGMSLLLITHDLSVVANMADRVYVMYSGKIVESGPVADVFTHPFHPYTAGLIESVPRLTDTAQRFVQIPDTVPHPISKPAGCYFHPRCKRVLDSCREHMPPLETPAPGREVRCWNRYD